MDGPPNYFDDNVAMAIGQHEQFDIPIHSNMFNLIKICSKLFQCVQKFIQNANVCPNDLVALTNIVQKKTRQSFIAPLYL